MVPDEDPLALRAEQQPPLLQGADDRRRERVAARGDPVDAFDRLVEAVGGEMSKRVLVGPGAGAVIKAASTPSASTSATKRSLKARIPMVPAFEARRPDLADGPPPSCQQTTYHFT